MSVKAGIGKGGSAEARPMTAAEVAALDAKVNAEIEAQTGASVYQSYYNAETGKYETQAEATTDTTTPKKGISPVLIIAGIAILAVIVYNFKTNKKSRKKNK